MSKNLKIIIGCILALIFAFFVWFLSDDVFSGDDTMSLVSLLQGGGKYNIDGIFTAIITQTVGIWIPKFLHINLHQFSMTAGAWIRAFNVAIFCVVMPLFAFNGRKKGKSFIFFTLFSLFYFCYASSNMNFDWANPFSLPNYEIFGSFVLLTEYAHHFGQFLSLILGLGVIYFITAHFTQNKLPDEKSLKPLTVVAFLTAMSSMFVNLTVGFLLFGICIYLLILNKNTDKKILKEKGKIVYVPTIAYAVGAILFGIYPSYFNFISSEIFSLTFLKSLFKFFVVSNVFELALILILAAILYFLALHKSTYIKRTIFTVFATLFGAFVYFMLFSSTGAKIDSLLTESLILFRILTMSFVFLLFGACLREHTSEPKELKVVSALFTIVLVAFMVVQIPLTFTTMSMWKTASGENKATIYCLEKMYRFYSLQGKTALLPDDALMKIFKIQPFVDDANLDNLTKINNRVFFKDTSFISYYKKFYNGGKVVPYKFIDAKMAVKIFFEEGGIIDGEEVSHINFQNLYKDKFVLHRAIEKSRYDI